MTHSLCSVLFNTSWKSVSKPLSLTLLPINAFRYTCTKAYLLEKGSSSLSSSSKVGCCCIHEVNFRKCFHQNDLKWKTLQPVNFEQFKSHKYNQHVSSCSCSIRCPNRFSQYNAMLPHKRPVQSTTALSVFDDLEYDLLLKSNSSFLLEKQFNLEWFLNSRNTSETPQYSEYLDIKNTPVFIKTTEITCSKKGMYDFIHQILSLSFIYPFAF